MNRILASPFSTVGKQRSFPPTDWNEIVLLDFNDSAITNFEIQNEKNFHFVSICFSFVHAGIGRTKDFLFRLFQIFNCTNNNWFLYFLYLFKKMCFLYITCNNNVVLVYLLLKYCWQYYICVHSHFSTLVARQPFDI